MKAEPLVLAHINGLSVAVIERRSDCFREFIGRGKSGIYVLRKNREIYYVLASSLRSILADHMKDHHKAKWDEFDLYIIRRGKAKYMRELEALLVRVAKPSGNALVPNFLRHNNITKKLKEALFRDVESLFLSDSI